MFKIDIDRAKESWSRLTPPNFFFCHKPPNIVLTNSTSTPTFGPPEHIVLLKPPLGALAACSQQDHKGSSTSSVTSHRGLQTGILPFDIKQVSVEPSFPIVSRQIAWALDSGLRNYSNRFLPGLQTFVNQSPSATWSEIDDDPKR